MVNILGFWCPKPLLFMVFGVHGFLYIPWKLKDYLLNVFPAKTMVLVRVYNQQLQGTSLLIVFDAA